MRFNIRSKEINAFIERKNIERKQVQKAISLLFLCDLIKSQHDQIFWCSMYEII